MKQFLISLSLLLIPATSYGVIIDRVAAVINDEVVALSEIDEAEYLMANQGNKQKKVSGDKEAIKKEILEKFIDRKLQLQEAKRLNIKATDENINNAISDIKDKNNIPDNGELIQALSSQGLTLKDLRRQLSERIMIAKLINHKVRARVQVSVEDIRAYYKEHFAQYRLMEEINARHILIQVPENTSPETVEKIRSDIENIAAELDGGADFSETAKKYSQAPDAAHGGDLGYFKRGQMIPEIDQVVFTLQPGKRSGVVRTPFGFHIFEVLDRKEHTIDNDPDLRKEIEHKISRKKTEERLKEFLRELREKAFINIMEGP